MDGPIATVAVDVDPPSPSRSRSPSPSGTHSVWPSATESSQSSSVSVASTNRDKYPKKGKTRIPIKLVSQRAILDLGYPFFVEGNIIIIQKALGQDNIDELLALSERYKNEDGENPVQYGIHKIPVDQEGNIFTSGKDGDSSKRSWVNQILVAGLVGLNSNGLHGNIEPASPDIQNAWTKPKTLLEDGTISAELSNVHAAEYYQDQNESHKVTLLCPNRPSAPKEKVHLVKMRWLHLTGTSLKLRTLEDLVTSCPYIPTKLKSVALSVLLEVDRQCSMMSESRPHVESGTIVRYIGHTRTNTRLYQSNPTQDTRPVVFISTPSLAVPVRYSATTSGHKLYAKTLLEFLYGYDAGSLRQPPFGAPQSRDVGKKSARNLQVPETWFLLIGSDILISSSELSRQEMTCSNIMFDRKVLGSSPGIYTVRVVDNARMYTYHIVIERDCNYANFLKHAAGLAQDRETTADMYVLIDELQHPIEPHAWLDLMTSGEVENRIFGLQMKEAEPSLKNKQEFLALSAKLIEGQIASDSAISTQQLQIEGDTGQPAEREDMLALVKSPGRQLQAFSSANGFHDQETFIHPVDMIRVPPINRHRLQPTLGEESLTFQNAEANASAVVSDNDTPMQLAIPRPRPYEIDSNRESDMGIAEDTYQGPLHNGFELEHRTLGYRFIPRRNSGNDVDSLDGFISSPHSELNVDVNTVAGEKDIDSQAKSSIRPPSFTSVREASIVPFLTWRLSWDTDESTPEESDRALIQLLNRIHGSLTKSDFGNYYLNSFSSTKEDVVRRCQMLTSIPDEEMAPTAYCDSSEGYPLVARNAWQYQALFEASDSILSMFLPTFGSASAHPICNRFWGTIDLILRQIYLSSVSPRHFTRTSCVTVSPLLSHIKKGTGTHSAIQSPSDECKHCNERIRYSSPFSALTHIHTDHLQCEHSSEGSRVLDDPCLGWVQWHGFENEPDGTVMSTVVEVIDTLNDIRDKAHEIHLSVIGPAEGENSAECRPHLPSNLVHCFEGIMGKLVLTAKELSWMNRTRLRQTEMDLGSTPIPLTMIREQRKKLDNKLQENFNLAKRDVMVLGTSRGDIDRLVISPIGSEFLLVTLLSNLQNNTVIQGAGQKMDIIKHYRKVSTGLRFGAVRDPKKQRFLEISALEEELDAIRSIIDVQGRMIEAFRKVLDPDFFNASTTDWAYLKDRKAMYPLEKTHLESQARKLAEDSKTLEVLKQIAQSTRHDMKQIIEVLEEGHGKAIRVFTFVTLFFLPLSFVTSFFGMNTTDIRDTTWDQAIFWSSAVPVTLLVLAMALIYGYRWDEVTNLFTKTFKHQRETRLHDILEQDLTPLMGEGNAGHDKISRTHSTSAYREPWISGLLRSKKSQQRKKDKNDVQRRQTFDSLLA